MSLAPQPDLKQFQIVRVARISQKHITPDALLRNFIKFPATCLVSRWPLSDVEKADLENTDLENIVHLLLQKR